ncbi:hypothetical protein [Deinococcus indicus]|nr:hypothetical protein [Deinococcus indicus]
MAFLSWLIFWLIPCSGVVLTGLSLFLLPSAWQDIQHFSPRQRRPARVLFGAYGLLAVSPFLPTLLFAVWGTPLSWSVVLEGMIFACPLMMAVFAVVLGANASVDSRPRPPGASTTWPGRGQTLLLLTPLWTILLSVGPAFAVDAWPVPSRAVVGAWETGGYDTTTTQSEFVAQQVILHADGTVTGEERGGQRAPRPLQGRYSYDPATRELSLDVPGLNAGSSEVTRDPFQEFHLKVALYDDRTLYQQSH